MKSLTKIFVVFVLTITIAFCGLQGHANALLPLSTNLIAKIRVGGLSWNTTDDSLRQAFSEFGEVIDSIVVTDRDTGRSRGFGYVTMESENAESLAIEGLNERELDGSRIKVEQANVRGSSKSFSSGW